MAPVTVLDGGPVRAPDPRRRGFASLPTDFAAGQKARTMIRFPGIKSLNR